MSSSSLMTAGLPDRQAGGLQASHRLPGARPLLPDEWKFVKL